MKIDMRARPRRACLWGEVILCEMGLDEPDVMALLIRVDDRNDDVRYLAAGQVPGEGVRMSCELSWLSWPPKGEVGNE